MATATDETMICVEAHLNPNQPGELVQIETEWPATHPVVQAAPGLFMPKGTGRQFWPHPERYAVAANDQNSAELEEQRKAAFERRAKANVLKLEQPAYVTLKKDWTGEFEGAPATLKRGSRLAADHPFVVEHQELFA